MCGCVGTLECCVFSLCECVRVLCGNVACVLADVQ